jgi:hypothetical protein
MKHHNHNFVTTEDEFCHNVFNWGSSGCCFPGTQIVQRNDDHKSSTKRHITEDT